MPVAAAADLEELVVYVFEDASTSVICGVLSSSWWARSDGDPLADVGGGDPDHEPAAHTGHFLSSGGDWSCEIAGLESCQVAEVAP